MSIDQRTDKQKEVDAEILERVKKGILKLERQYGPEWVEKFGGMKDFNLANGDYCVLGKVYGGYQKGLAALGVRDDENEDVEDIDYEIRDETETGVSLGFNDYNGKLGQLQEVWKRELSKLGVTE